MAFGVLDFIHADGVDVAQLSVFQAPGDDMLDGVENLVPRSAKGLGGFFPGEAARPAGEAEHLALVKVGLPSPQGTSSTTAAAQRRQSTRRMAYSRKTKNPQRGMNSKRRSGS